MGQLNGLRIYQILMRRSRMLGQGLPDHLAGEVVVRTGFVMKVKAGV